MDIKTLNKILNQAFAEGEKSAIKKFAKYSAIWLILALRHEGFGQKRVIRVLDHFFHYVGRYVAGDLDMEQLKDYTEKTVGIKFEFSDEGTYKIIGDDTI